MKRNFSLLLILLVSSLLGCSEKSSLLEGLLTNNAPDTPEVYSPANGSTGKSTTIVLSWTGNDPDGDVLTYNVYFGTSPATIQIVSSGKKDDYLEIGYLAHNTTYYWKIVAKDNKGASTESPVWSFETGDPPNIAPLAPSNPNPSSNLTTLYPTVLILSWSCDDPNGDPLTYDVYFGTSPSPDLFFIVSVNQTEKSFTPSGLTNNTIYYWKIVAKDSWGGTTEGQIWQFKTQSIVTGYDFYFDGHIYKTVVIGTQVWTVENLQTTKYNDGSSIVKITTNTTDWSTNSNGAYCAYETTESYVATYGYLYNWYAVNTGKLAPAGWRVPTDADWTKLTDYVGGAATAGTKLKSKTGWSTSTNTGTDIHGFSALPGGYRSSSGDFGNVGSYGYWWSSTAYDTNNAWYHFISYHSANVNKNSYYKSYGWSVRLVRDL